MATNGRTTPIRSPTNFKSRIPQKIDDLKLATSPTTGRPQSKIPRSTSLKQNSVKNQAEVLVQRQISEPAVKTTQEEKYDLEHFQSQPPTNPIIKNTKTECFNGNSQDSAKNGKFCESASDECSNKHSKLPEYEYEVISNGTNYEPLEISESGTITNNNTARLISNVSELQLMDGSTLDSCISNGPTSYTDLKNIINQRYNTNQLVYEIQHSEIPDQPSAKSSSSLLGTTTQISNKGGELITVLDDILYTSAMEKEGQTATKFDRPSSNNIPDVPASQNTSSDDSNFSKTPTPDDDSLGDNFERTEHDNDDYTTTTTTEYEKDGKVVRTTETVNYMNDRNIKTIVTTSEKIVTIPFGQKLDLSSPEITSSTTVRSKYLQTMLQSREFEGDKEVNAQTLETIETDVQTDKIDSNDNTNDPDLDTILIIVETLDEVRKTEPKIKQFSGTNTNDPVYTELISILNSCLSKFENINSKDKANVEEKRKNGIDYIQGQIALLNSKLKDNEMKIVENESKEIPSHANGDNRQQKSIIQTEQKQPTVENEKNQQQKGPETESSAKKERKKSTLKKHFKFGNKDKTNGDEQKKKKKKMCVIS